jgi:hypothetical protein
VLITVAFGWVYIASALLIGTDRSRGEPRWHIFRSPRRARAARAAAALLVLGAALLWSAAEPGPAAFIAIPVALLACGTVMTLLVPFRPRLVWALAVAALPLTLLLAAIGGVLHG